MRGKPASRPDFLTAPEVPPAGEDFFGFSNENMGFSR